MFLRPQAKYNSSNRIMSAARDFVMSIHDDDYKYFEGHMRDGLYIFFKFKYLINNIMPEFWDIV